MKISRSFLSLLAAVSLSACSTTMPAKDLSLTASPLVKMVSLVRHSHNNKVLASAGKFNIGNAQQVLLVMPYEIKSVLPSNKTISASVSKDFPNQIMLSSSPLPKETITSLMVVDARGEVYVFHASTSAAEGPQQYPEVLVVNSSEPLVPAQEASAPEEKTEPKTENKADVKSEEKTPSAAVSEVTSSDKI